MDDNGSAERDQWGFAPGETSRILGRVPTFLLSSVVPLIWNDEGKLRPIGTAWAITPQVGVFVTAEHVLLGVPGFDQSTQGVADVPDPQLFGMFPTSDVAADWVPVRITDISGGTVGEVLMIRFDVSRIPAFAMNTMRGLPINTARPELGSECLALGFPDTAVLDGTKSGRIEKPLEFRASKGAVTDVHPHRRDTFSGTFPSFAIEALTPSGMSGGPVFDEQGLVAGLVSRGFEFGEDGPDYALIALIAPLMSLPFPVGSSMEPIGRHFEANSTDGAARSVTVQPHPRGGIEVVWNHSTTTHS